MTMRMEMMAGLCLFALISGCSPQAKPAAPPAAEAAPVSALKSAPEFAKCTWQEIKGAKLSLQAFACGPEQGDVHIEADDTLPGFKLVFAGAPAASRVAMRTFDKAAAAPLDSILPAVRAISPGPMTANCGFSPSAGYDDRGKGRVVLEPQGADKATWEASQVSDTPMEAPCGWMGVSIAGNRFFQVMPGHPDKVIYADMGSDIQIFDPETLRVIP